MVNDEVQNRVEFEDDPVANLLRDLKRVDAPKDFDYRVRARIARETAVEKRRKNLPLWAKAAIPAALLLAAGGYVGFNSRPISPADETVFVTEPTIQTKQPDPVTPRADVIPSPEVADNLPAKSKTRRTPAPPRRKAAADPVGGGSVDSAVRASRTIEIADISAADALSRAGARVTFEGSSLKVDSTAAGAANRSGLRAGDVIESIDGKAVDVNTRFKGSAAGKKLRVRRDGKTLDIVIKN